MCLLLTAQHKLERGGLLCWGNCCGVTYTKYTCTHKRWVVSFYFFRVFGQLGMSICQMTQILQIVKMYPLPYFPFLMSKNVLVFSGWSKDTCLCILVLSLCHKWPSAVNYINLTEARFRSFSALTNTTDLDPVKQKKADVIGLRKSSRGVEPHPFLQQPLHFPPVSVQNPSTYPAFKLS